MRKISSSWSHLDKAHGDRLNRRSVLLREFDLPLSEEKKEILEKRQREGTILNGEKRKIKVVFTRKKALVYAV
jgi:hypothetical protein